MHEVDGVYFSANSIVNLDKPSFLYSFNSMAFLDCTHSCEEAAQYKGREDAAPSTFIEVAFLLVDSGPAGIQLLAPDVIDATVLGIKDEEVLWKYIFKKVMIVLLQNFIEHIDGIY